MQRLPTQDGSQAGDLDGSRTSNTTSNGLASERTEKQSRVWIADEQLELVSAPPN